MRENLNKIDQAIIDKLKILFHPFARIALFVVFFWFGLLKVIDSSPASELVASLLRETMPFITAEQFILGLGIYEMAIGIAFLLPRFERLAIALLVPHMITTVMPLFLLPSVTWQSPLVPTLEGQYIIKNLALIALAMGIGAHLTPWQSKS